MPTRVYARKVQGLNRDFFAKYLPQVLLYKVLNDYTGPNLKESLIWRNTRQTNYDLRSSLTDLTLPKPNREFLKKSFNYSGAKLWNSLPLDAKVAESVYQFKNIIRGNDS